MSEKFGIINDAGTFVEVTAEQFPPFKAAGYRKLKANEDIPLQVLEELGQPRRGAGWRQARRDAEMIQRARNESLPTEADEPTE